MREHFYVIQLLIEADVIKVPPPESCIKQIRRGWPGQLWPNKLVWVYRDEDLSANPFRICLTPRFIVVCALIFERPAF